MPRQLRSRATLTAILDAAAHILGERGWAGLTTNAVAEKAGVSIGSLYQYAPDKLALIEALRQRHFAEVLAALAAGADGRRVRAERLTAFVDGMIAAHARYPASYSVLMEGSPRGDVSRAAHDVFDAQHARACEALFLVNARREADARIGGQVLAAALAGAVHEAARRGDLDASAIQTELLHLVEGCLSPALTTDGADR